MPLDGLRAWVAEVERKLGMRTRVFLALAALAVGIAGASVYLALDARSDSVSEGDVRELQERLEERIQQVEGQAGGGLAPEPAPQPAPRPQPEPEQDEPEGGAGTGEGNQGKDLQDLLEGRQQQGDSGK